MRSGSPTIRRLTIIAALGLTTLIVGLTRSVLVASLTEVGEGQPPKLVLSQANLDFEKVTAGQRLKGYVGLRNVGGRRLVVHKTVSDCACCDEQSNAPVIIGPNRIGRLPVEVVAPRHPGAMTRVLSFETNDPKLPRFSVTMRATVGL